VRRPTIDDPALPLARIFEAWPGTARAFLARRMLCWGCPVAPFHGVGDACHEYGLDEETFRAELRHAVDGDGS
jgi:hybrid cluster-associated redox disulfide protein